MQTLPANGNFLLMLVPDSGSFDATEVDLQLKRQGIIVRPTKSFGIHNGLRVTIGNHEEMQLLTTALREMSNDG